MNTVRSIKFTTGSRRFFAILLGILLICPMAIPAFVRAADAPTVYVTISDGNGKLVLTRAAVSITDADGDNAITINDALYAAHAAHHKDGEDAYKTVESAWGLSLTKLWGVENGGSYGYYLNNASPMSLADPIKDGDTVQAFIYTDTDTFSDQFCFFDQGTINGKAGDTVSLTLKAAGFDAANNYAPIEIPVSGATITVDGKDSGVKTDEEGKFTLTLSGTGTIVISAISETQTLVPPVCVVRIQNPQTGDIALNMTAYLALALVCAAALLLRARSHEA